jgi:hypothetical protein
MVIHVPSSRSQLERWNNEMMGFKAKKPILKKLFFTVKGGINGL